MIERFCSGRLPRPRFSDSIGNAGTPEGTYIGAVRHNVDTIVGALTKDNLP